MRFAPYVWLFCSFILVVPVWSQQTQAPELQLQPIVSQQSPPVTMPLATKDPQAVGILNQSLSIAGGATAIKALADYTATGNITYGGNPDSQGPVTVLGLGMDQIRLDANLPRGMKSSAISAGQTTTKTEDGRLTQYPPPYPVPSSEAHIYQPPMFPGSLLTPHTQLLIVLNHPRFSIAYKGVVQLDGNSVHDIQALRVMPGQTQPDDMTEYHTVDFFIDATTLQLVMTQDSVPNHVVHQIRYSDYRPANGVLVPFSISEQMGGQSTRDIRLGQVSFNTGLQDSAFAIQ